MATPRPDTWMPVYWGDYAKDTGHLNNAGHGAYLMLIKHYWCSGKPLPDDNDELWRIACCDSKRAWLKLRPKLDRLFVTGNGMLRHKRVDAEIAAAAAKVERRANAGRKGANKRWHNDGNAMPMPPDSQWQNDGTSQSPVSESIDARGRTKLRQEYEDVFLPAYPRKSDKKPAGLAFERARQGGTSLQTIMDGVERLNRNVDPRYAPSPLKFLDGEKWNDEYPASPANPNHRTGMRPESGNDALGRALAKRAARGAAHGGHDELSPQAVAGDPPGADRGDSNIIDLKPVAQG